MSDAFSNALQKLTERRLHQASCRSDNPRSTTRQDNDAAESCSNAASPELNEHLLRSMLNTFTATAHLELSPPATLSAEAELCSEVEHDCPMILQHPCAVQDSVIRNFPREKPEHNSPPVGHPQPTLCVPQTEPTFHAAHVPVCPVVESVTEPAAPAAPLPTQPTERSSTKFSATFANSPAGKLLARLSQPRTSEWQKRVEGLLENRRHAAAAVVAVCMAVLWLTPPTTPTAQSVPPSEASDMDSILAEFDSADQQRPEPAEPLQSSFEDLTIPHSTPANSPTRDFGTETAEAGAGLASGSELRDGSNLFPSAPATSATAEEGSGQKVRVRLTKNITPLN
jgi:hypothetical protein